MATQRLPKNDPNLLLAQRLGESLRSGADFSDLEDKLVDQLVGFKNDELSSYENTTPKSLSIWEGIEAKTSAKAKILPFYQRSIGYAWAAAAVLLIAAFVGFYWVSINPNPTLVAKTDSLITTFILEDGTQVTLRPYSELYELAFNETERSFSLIGEGYFNVTTDLDRPFSVQAGEGLVTVLGTRFNLSNWGNITQVFLEEGSIQFETSLEELVILEPGQKSTLQNGSVLYPEQAEADQFKDWISNTIVFNASFPNEVVAEIGQHFNVVLDISLLDAGTKLDGTLKLDTIEQTLEDLGLVLGGTFRKTSDSEYSFISID